MLSKEELTRFRIGAFAGRGHSLLYLDLVVLIPRMAVPPRVVVRRVNQHIAFGALRTRRVDLANVGRDLPRAFSGRVGQQHGDPTVVEHPRRVGNSKTTFEQASQEIDLRV